MFEQGKIYDRSAQRRGSQGAQRRAMRVAQKSRAWGHITSSGEDVATAMNPRVRYMHADGVLIGKRDDELKEMLFERRKAHEPN